MKTKLMKKAIAVTLSAAMAFSLSSANMVTASAASSYVKLNTTFKTLSIGQKYALKLKNNTAGWKIKTATSKDSAVCDVYSKTTKAAALKGVSEGKTKITVKIATSKRKKNNTKTLSCIVRVKAAAANEDPTTPVQTEANVTTQSELDSALADKNLKKITIAPTGAASLKIAAGDYKTVDLVVNAPQADIENSGVFNSVEIQAIKDNTWTEKAVGNILNVLAKAACRIVVDKDAQVKGITFGSANNNVALVANGKVEKVTINATVTIAISGETKVPVTIGKDAADTDLTASTPVDIDTVAKVAIKLEKGAEDSAIAVTADNVAITVNNQSDKAVKIVKNDKSEDTVIAGGSKTIAPTVPKDTPNNTTTPNVPSNNTNKADNDQVVNVSTIGTTSTAKVEITSGASATVISTGALSFNFEGVQQISGSAIEYSATFKNSDGKYLGTQNWKEASMTSDTNNGVTTYKYSGTVSTDNLCTSSNVTVEISFRVKATNALKEGPVSKATATVSISTSDISVVNGIGKIDAASVSISPNA